MPDQALEEKERNPILTAAEIAGDLQADDLSDNVIERFAEKIYPAGMRCPRCQNILTETQKKALLRGGRVVCKHCQKWFSFFYGTRYLGTHLTIKQIAWLALLLDCGLSNREAAKRIDLHVDTVNSWRHRFAGRPSSYMARRRKSLKTPSSPRLSKVVSGSTGSTAQTSLSENTSPGWATASPAENPEPLNEIICDICGAKNPRNSRCCGGCYAPLD